jgi:hypothetical protein
MTRGLVARQQGDWLCGAKVGDAGGCVAKGISCAAKRLAAQGGWAGWLRGAAPGLVAWGR